MTTSSVKLGLFLITMVLSTGAARARDIFTTNSGIPQMMVLNAMRSRITVGETVYIGKAQLTGQSSEIVTLTLDSKRRVTIPFDSVTAWEVSMQAGSGNYMGEGMLVGSMGALLGGLAALTGCGDLPPYPCFVSGAILLGAPAFLVATLIGAAIEKPEEWTMVYRAP